MNMVDFVTQDVQDTILNTAYILYSEAKWRFKEYLRSVIGYSPQTVIFVSVRLNSNGIWIVNADVFSEGNHDYGYEIPYDKLDDWAQNAFSYLECLPKTNSYRMPWYP